MERGLGVRAPSRIDCSLDGLWDRFEASVGVDDVARFQGSVVFAIRLDGKEVLRTEVTRGGGGEPRAIRVPCGGARLLSLIVEDAGDGPEGGLADWGNPRVVAAPCAPMLERSHSHNDYLRARPLLDALDRGFTSAEADIFLVDGAILVGHERASLDAGRTLEALYLDPLLERARRHGGRVYPELPVFQLLVDIKEDGEKVYPVLREVLSRYAEMLTVFRPQRVEAKGVAVILSGDCPRAILAAEKERLAAVDGRLVDLERAPTPPPSLVPLVSQAWGSVFAWRGPFAMPEEERGRLHALVATAHAQGRKIRFWGTLDLPIVWKELLDAGVDYVNVDDLDGLVKFLGAREAKPGAASPR
jgi:hypothetical protein